MRVSTIFATLFAFVWLAVLTAPASAAPKPIAQSSPASAYQDRDSDGDGLSDFQEIHKYFTDPHKRSTAGDGTPDGQWDRRREFTYTITTVLRIAKPFDIRAMNDDYQDARILKEDKNSAVVEVVSYPLNTNDQAIGEDPNWRKDDAGMAQFLYPTPTENWDAQMRADLLSALKTDGIDLEKLTDKQLVEQVSKWAFGRSQYTDTFCSFDIFYPKGQPMVYPPLRKEFDSAKPTPQWTDAELLDQEVLGKQMFYKKLHGACTSSSIYISTILRALGIPTRTIICIPPADGNDPRQIAMLVAHITNNRVREILKEGMPTQGFSDHMFNEVFVGHRWVRLNYDILGQNILTPDYFGLLIHVDTCASISDLPIAQTWGMRGAYYGTPAGGPKLSSINPYMLLSVSDHFGKYCHLSNPPTPELKTVTINGLYWKDSDGLPAGIVSDPASLPANFFLISMKEHIADQTYLQYVTFAERAGRDFVLSALGQPDLHVTLDSHFSGFKDGSFQSFYAEIDPADYQKMTPGVDYTIRSVATADAYRWVVAPGTTIRKEISSTPPAAQDEPTTPADKSTADLHQATIIGLSWKNSQGLPDWVVKALAPLPPTTLLIQVKEHIAGQGYQQYRRFGDRAGHEFLLQAPGHPDVHIELPGGNSINDGGGQFAAFVTMLTDAEYAELAPGVAYTIDPLNTSDDYKWLVADGVSISRP